MKGLIKCSILLLVLIVSSGVAGAVESINGALHYRPVLQIFRMTDIYWQSRDLMENGESNGACRLSSELASENKAFAATIRGFIKSDAADDLRAVSLVFASLDEGSRNAVLPALRDVYTALTVDNDNLGLARFREYFPGYGYSTPGYRYRRGNELDREFKGFSSQYEEHLVKSSKSVNITVSIDIVDILRRLFSFGKIGNLRIGEPRKLLPSAGWGSGQPMIVVDVSFSSEESMLTKCNRRYEVNKIWFELYRTSSPLWKKNPEWELCGRTYQINHEPTGEFIVTDIRVDAAETDNDSHL